MFRETERRIREGLVSSLDGGSLKWLQGYQAPNPLLEGVDPARIPPMKQTGAELHRAGEKGPPEKTASTPAGKAGGAAPVVAQTAVSAALQEAEEAGVLNFEYATGFLKTGFEELLKCRCVSDSPLLDCYYYMGEIFLLQLYSCWNYFTNESLLLCTATDAAMVVPVRILRV